MGIILSSKTTKPNAHSMIFDETYRLTFMAPAVCLSTPIEKILSIDTFEKKKKITKKNQLKF